MAETVRDLSALLALMPVSTPNGTSAQDVRDGFNSAIGVVHYIAKSANYTATDDDEVIDVTTGSSAITITLPAVATTRVGKQYTIRKADSGTGTVIVDANASEIIGEATTGLTQILFTQFAYLTIVNTGSLWLILASRAVVSGATFIATAAATVANTTTETTLIGGGNGSATLPANFWRVGKSLRVRAWGVVSDTGTPTLTINLKIGSTTLCTTGAITLGSGISNVHFTLDAILTCRTTGATGTIMSQGVFMQNAVVSGLTNTAADTIDTTAAAAVDVTATWGAASASNTISSHNVTVELLNP